MTDALRLTALVASTLLIAAPAIAQPAQAPQGNPAYQVAVRMSSFDLASDTYTALVSVSGQPCPNVSFGVGFGVGGVKNADDAKDKYKAQITKIADDIRQTAAHCSDH